MKKLVIYNASLERGGAERVTVYLADYMVKNGIPCRIITSTIGKNEYAVPNNVDRIAISKKRKLGIKDILNLRKEIKAFNADMVLIMGVSNCIYAMPALIGLKVKSVVSERNDPSHFAGKNFVRVISRVLMKLADGFVFQTNDAKGFYAKSLKNCGAVIFNPLIMENFPEPYLGKRKKQIVSVGRLIEQKNHRMLIDAFNIIKDRYPEYQLVIYGEGPLRPEIEKYIEEMGLTNRTSLPGNVSDVHERIKKANAFVMCSNFEGMPNALIESMALGIPSISTDCPCGGPKSLIESGMNGLLVPVGDVDSLVEAIIKIIDNEEFASKIGNNAIEIRNKLDVNVIGEQWKDYLNSI